MFYAEMIIIADSESDEETAVTLSSDESDYATLSPPENDTDSESLHAWRVDENHNLDLVMLDHDLIFEAVGSAFYEALQHDRDTISQLTVEKLCQSRLCCRCCAIYHFGVLCYSTSELVEIVEGAVQAGNARSAIVQRIEDGGDPYLIDEISCECTCCCA